MDRKKITGFDNFWGLPSWAEQLVRGMARESNGNVHSEFESAPGKPVRDVKHPLMMYALPDGDICTECAHLDHSVDPPRFVIDLYDSNGNPVPPPES